MSRPNATRTTFAILAIAFFATPITAHILGTTTQPIENRKLANPPKLTQGWNALNQTTQYITDHLPLRAQAIKTNTHIWTNILKTTPRYGRPRQTARRIAAPVAGAPQDPAASEANARIVADMTSPVVMGTDGWLFFEEELSRSCDPAIAAAPALARWRELVETVRATGRRAILVVVPDKASIYPEYVGADRLPACAVAGKRQLWQLVRGLPPAAGIVGLYDPLVRRKTLAGDDLYSRKDSHWTSVGSLSMVTAVLERIGGGVTVDEADLDPVGRQWYTGDLTVLLGDSEIDVRAVQSIHRPPNAPRIAGRTAIVGDSFSVTPLPQLGPYFRTIGQTRWSAPERRQIVDAVAAADTVIFETVERELTQRAVDGGLVVSLRGALRDLERP